MAKLRLRKKAAKVPPTPAQTGIRLSISDDREFPTLSNGPQAQQNTSAQQMWSNPNLRTAQHSTIGRPQGQVAGHGQTAPGASTPHQQLQTQGHEDVPNAGQGQFSGGGDDYRFGGSAGVGQLSGSSQPSTSNIDDFPPLGGAAGDIGPDRRSIIQTAAAYQGSVGASAFPGLGQTRNGLSSPTDGQDRALNSAVGGRGVHPGSGELTWSITRSEAYHAVSRTPFDSMRSSNAGLQDVDRNVGDLHPLLIRVSADLFARLTRDRRKHWAICLSLGLNCLSGVQQGTARLRQ